MNRVLCALILTAIVFSAACGSGDKSSGKAGKTGETVTDPAAPAGMETVATPSEDPREATRRLLYLERALERWAEADIRQQYARRDSMASLMRTYAVEHFDAMVKDLRHGSPRRRIVMAGTLGFCGAQKVVEPLGEALRDQYYEVVLHALASFYHLAKTRDANGNKVEIDIDPRPIIAFLSHPRGEVRGNAALALTRILGPDSPAEFLVSLIAAAEDPDSATRVHAIGAIGAMKRVEGFPHLVAALDDNVQLVRVRAAINLGRLGNRDAVFALISVLERDQEAEDVRKAAARALGALLGGGSGLEAKEWRNRAIAVGVPGFTKK